MSSRLFVGNLSYNTTRDELCALFNEVDVIDSCHLIIDRNTNRSKGFGFIEMNSLESAHAAKVKMQRARPARRARPSNEEGEA